MWDTDDQRPDAIEEDAEPRSSGTTSMLVLLAVNLLWMAFVGLALAQAPLTPFGPAWLPLIATTLAVPLGTLILWRIHRNATDARNGWQASHLAERIGTFDTLMDRLRLAEQQAAASLAELERRGAALADAAGESSRQLLATGEAIAGQAESLATQHRTLDASSQACAARLEALDRDAREGLGRVAETLDDITARTEQLDFALAKGNAEVGRLVAGSESLLLALDSGIRELEESLPTAFGKAEARFAALEARMKTNLEQAEAIARNAETLVIELNGSGESATRHAAVLEKALADGQTALAAQQSRIADIQAAVAGVQSSFAGLGEADSARLLAALEDVRTAARQTSEDAQRHIDAMVTDAVRRISEGGTEALDIAVGQKVAAQIDQVAQIADNAAKSAHRATDHLLRQMMSISDSAESLESRIRSVAEAEAARDRDHIAARSDALLAALGNNAIDISRALGQEISDKEWSAYLKGDKSLFVRRSVRLLSGSELRDIHAQYDADDGFRENVNRYVADFEAMLAEVMEGRNGHSLAIALLSSDVGRLYVALAQAIERLRVA